MGKEREIVTRATHNNIVVNGYESLIPTMRKGLLYFSDEDPQNVQLGTTMTFSILMDGKVDINFSLGPEPSTIYLRMPVRKPDSTNQVPPLNYGPKYAELTPEKKWIYLDWLKDISKLINIGYVFIYYYGLERQLLLGDFDGAVDELLRLRSSHNHRSFLSYSKAALLNSCIIKNRPDRLADIYRTGELWKVENLELYIAYLLGYNLTPKNLMGMAFHVRGANLRYIRSCPYLFESSLVTCLKTKFGGTNFPFASRYNLEELHFRPDVRFANCSFPEDIRTQKLPYFYECHPFINEVRNLLEEAHKITKGLIREHRKRK
jgi:hypothetical protein